MLSIFKFIFNPDWFTFSFGGGGGGPSTTKTETSNIPEYAQPYVERMMGASERQVYTYGPSGNITGFQPFQSYSEFAKRQGGTGETVAGFTPMQARAMQGIGGYQMPGQTAAASGMTADIANRAIQAGQYQPGYFGNFYNAPSPYQAGRFGVRDVGTGSFLQPGAAEAYMSPYQQAVTDIEKREATRASDIMKQQQQAQAVQAGAFGGSRQAIVEAERQRNLMQQIGDIQARGGQSAFQQAQQQFNVEQQAGLQAQLANQQARMQAQQAREQSRQFGYGQGMTAAELGARYGLSGAELGEKSRQFGAGLRMQGIEQARGAAGQLGALGEQQYKQELGLLGQQYDVGAKQQAYEQARLNQIIQDYATKQQYPFIQLGTLSNMLRGLPMQASTTQLYQAQPPLLQQGIGLAGAYANLKQAGVNMPFGKEGGAVKEMASGGIASGVDRYKLPSMVEKLSDKQLEGKLGGDTDPETMGIAQAEKQRRDHIRKGMADGGAVAFKEGEMVKNPMLGSEEPKKEEPKKEAPAVATRPKAAAPKPAPVEKSPYQAEFKRALAEPSPIAPEVASLRKQQAEEQAIVDLGTEGLMDRKQAAYKKYGIDPAAIFAQERADNKKYLEQAEGDAKKAEYLRWAQMWAKFGSTPGPVLKAALTSINETVPDLLDDQKYAINLQRSITKTLHDIDRAEYLDKKGNYDEAQKLLNEARGRVANLSIATSKLIADEYENKLKSKGQLAAEELKGQFGVKEASIRAAASGAGSGLAGERLDEQRRKAADVEHYRTMKGQYEQRSSLEKQLMYQKDPEKQKSIQSKIDTVNQKIMQDRNSRYTERGLQPPTSPLNPQEIMQPSGAAGDTSGWGELRVKGS